jgi:tetratricopeptide (TPR) repeat protein
MQSGFTAERDLGAVDAEDTGIASGGRAGRGDGLARDETEFHQTAGEILRQIETLHQRLLILAEVSQGSVARLTVSVFETDLHNGSKSSIRPLRVSGQSGAGWRQMQSRSCLRATIGGVAEAGVKTGYTRLEVCRLFNLAETVLEDWERHGFLPKQSHYGFQEMVALKTLRELRRNRYRPERIRLIVESLRERLRHIENPLTELKIFTDGRRLAVQVDGGRMEPLTGQLLLNFDREEIRRLLQFPGRPAEDELVRAAAARRFEADRWFEKAVELEQTGGTADHLIAAYERAIEADPGHSAALVNLGTVHFHQQDWARAESCYRKATEVQPDYALAHFNLGNLYDELGKVAKALDCYECTLRLDPGYADAHYNLALLYQGEGDSLKALKHWRAYLKLDPQCYWAAIARRELARVRDEAVISGKRAKGA